MYSFSIFSLKFVSHFVLTCTLFPHIFPFTSSQAFIAEVGPGDMLVVPPYWFHHVETLEESVSINIWSDAPEYALMNEM